MATNVCRGLQILHCYLSRRVRKCNYCAFDGETSEFSSSVIDDLIPEECRQELQFQCLLNFCELKTESSLQELPFLLQGFHHPCIGSLWVALHYFGQLTNCLCPFLLTKIVGQIVHRWNRVVSTADNFKVEVPQWIPELYCNCGLWKPLWSLKNYCNALCSFWIVVVIERAN